MTIPQNLTAEQRAQLAALKASRLGDSSTRDDYWTDSTVSFDEMSSSIESYANDLQVDWNQFDLSDIPFIKDISNVLENGLDIVNSGLDILKAAVAVVKAAANLVVTLGRVGVDALRAAYESLILFFEALIDGIQGTSGAALVHYYKNAKDKRYTVPAFFEAVAQSYDDTGDYRRPIMASTGDTQLFVSLIYAIPDPVAVLTVIEQLVNFFKLSWGSASDFTFRINGKIDPNAYPHNLYDGAPSLYPDWSGYSLEDIPLLGEFVAAVTEILDKIRPGATAFNSIISIIEIIETKLNEISALVNKLIRIIQEILSLSIPRLNMLTILGPGNKTGFQTALRSAVNLESYPLRLQGQNVTSDIIGFAFCTHLSLGTGKALDFVKSLFKLKDNLEGSLERMQPAKQAYEATTDNLTQVQIASQNKLNLPYKARFQ